MVVKFVIRSLSSALVSFTALHRCLTQCLSLSLSFSLSLIPSLSVRGPPFRTFVLSSNGMKFDNYTTLVVWKIRFVMDCY